MAKKKLNSSAPRPGKLTTDKTLNTADLPPTQVVVILPMNSANNIRNLDFTKYYGNGCDVLVYACQRVLEGMARSCTESGGKSVGPTTIVTYFQNGLSVFIPFCATMASALGRELRLDDIDREFMDQFLAHLRQSFASPTYQKNRYNHTKSVLKVMVQSGWIAKDIFPRNPFPNSNRKLKGLTALSEPERLSVMQALKTDMRAIFRGSGPLNAKELTVCLLAITARTGINPTPAIELLTDCLQPHPIKADRYVLVSFKRRGSNTHIQSLRRVADVESMVSALPDVARIIDLLVKRNAAIREASPYPNYLFVYESRGGSSNGKKIHLNNVNLFRGINVFLDDHQLKDADGRPVKLNVMRLRKTFENRLFTLSGQDPFLTAKLCGHTPKVSNDHYLEAPETAEKDWRLMGEIRNEELLNYAKVAPLPTQNTPVARCRDTLHGEQAPKNGEHCQKFLACFRCRSFVVTGDDLYRVFSFYWALIRMRHTMGASAWKRVYGHIIRIIDQEIAPKFDAELIGLHREQAKVDPHPFWRDGTLLEGAA